MWTMYLPRLLEVGSFGEHMIQKHTMMAYLGVILTVRGTFFERIAGSPAIAVEHGTVNCHGLVGLGSRSPVVRHAFGSTFEFCGGPLTAGTAFRRGTDLNGEKRPR